MTQEDTKGQVLWQPDCVVCEPFREKGPRPYNRLKASSREAWLWCGLLQGENNRTGSMLRGKLNILKTCANSLREINDIPKVLLIERSRT